MLAMSRNLGGLARFMLGEIDAGAIEVSSSEAQPGDIIQIVDDADSSPDADYNGPDSFTYTASDGTATSSIATVSITVNAVNDTPVAAFTPPSPAPRGRGSPASAPPTPPTP